MLLKKQALTGAYSGFQSCFCSTYTTSTSPSVLPVPRARPSPSSASASKSDSKRRRTTTISPTQTRAYATVKHSSKTYDFRDNMNWPCSKDPRPTSTQPTPYDIFDLDKTAVYSKHKFYELVKVYHPDRHSSTTPDQPIHSLTRPERLERYRLVVQAHTILSDPAKRRAYDLSGAGWGSQTPNYSAAQHAHTSTHPDSPFANATWEDWERWYARDPHNHSRHPTGPQTYQGTYFNHNAFASFVILIAVISGVLQATHVGTHVNSVEERAKAFTAQTHKFLNDRKVENAQYLTNEGTHGAPEPVTPVLGPAADERVRHFLERRDPNRWGLKEEEEGYYRQHFQGKNFQPPMGRKALPPPSAAPVGAGREVEEK